MAYYLVYKISLEYRSHLYFVVALIERVRIAMKELLQTIFENIFYYKSRAQLRSLIDFE